MDCRAWAARGYLVWPLASWWKMIYYGCPGCQAAMSAPDSRASGHEVCPACGSKVAVPAGPHPGRLWVLLAILSFVSAILGLYVAIFNGPLLAGGGYLVATATIWLIHLWYGRRLTPGREGWSPVIWIGIGFFLAVVLAFVIWLSVVGFDPVP